MGPNFKKASPWNKRRSFGAKKLISAAAFIRLIRVNTVDVKQPDDVQRTMKPLSSEHGEGEAWKLRSCINVVYRLKFSKINTTYFWQLESHRSSSPRHCTWNNHPGSVCLRWAKLCVENTVHKKIVEVTMIHENQ